IRLHVALHSMDLGRLLPWYQALHGHQSAWPTRLNDMLVFVEDAAVEPGHVAEGIRTDPNRTRDGGEFPRRAVSLEPPTLGGSFADQVGLVVNAPAENFGAIDLTDSYHFVDYDVDCLLPVTGCDGLVDQPDDCPR